MTDHDLFSTETAGLAQAAGPELIRLSDGDRFPPLDQPGPQDAGRRRAADARLQRLDPRPDAARRSGHARSRSRRTNDGDVETTVHWHGLRLENRYDGVPDETQAPIPLGGRYTYRLQFPDPGFYWYHPHIREDFAQEMGLYGTIIVEPTDPALLAAGRPRAGDHPRRPADRGRPDRPVPPLRTDLHGDGPVRQRHADQRRDRVRGSRPRSARSFACTWSTPPTPGSSTSPSRGARMKLVGGDSGRVEREDVRRRDPARAVRAGHRRRPLRDRRARCGSSTGPRIAPTTSAGSRSRRGRGRTRRAASFDELRTDPELTAERESHRARPRARAGQGPRLRLADAAPLRRRRRARRRPTSARCTPRSRDRSRRAARSAG